jgi:peptidoglycan/xylan/chitin deacetylase (PgdA/CDA1 family)
MTRVVALTVNVHGLEREAASEPASALYGRFAHGSYTYHRGLARLLDALRAAGVPATFFWPSAEAARCPALLERCLAEGHEVAAHGRAFEDHMGLEPAAEAALLEEAHAALTARCGRAPLGFRAPTGTLSAASFGLLHRLGYRYDSSQVDDDVPYSLAADGAPGMVELPFSEGLSDATHFGRRLTQSRAEAFLAEELDALLPSGNFACITLHPRGDLGLAREARVPVLLRLLDRARRMHGATFRLCREIAADALQSDGTVTWNEKARP